MSNRHYQVSTSSWVSVDILSEDTGFYIRSLADASLTDAMRYFIMRFDAKEYPTLIDRERY